MNRKRLRTGVSLFAATTILAGILSVSSAVPAHADTSYCGFTIDEIEPGQDPYGAFDQEARGFYDNHIAQLHSWFPSVSQADFCSAAWRLIDEGAQHVVFGAIRGVVAGNGLTSEQERVFNEALGRAVDGLPSAIPAVGGGSEETIGVHVADNKLYGTWAYTDTSDPTWRSADNQPANALYWFENGKGLAVDCQVTGVPYTVYYGTSVQTWSSYLHVTDGTYVRSAAVSETSSDDGLGLPSC